MGTLAVQYILLKKKVKEKPRILYSIVNNFISLAKQTEL